MTAWRGATMNVLLSGTPTVRNAQAMTNIDGGLWFKYQVSPTGITRQVWDPFATITVIVDGVTQNPSTYKLNRLFGTVTFNSALTSGNVVTTNITYLPMTAVASANSIDCTFSLADQDATVFQPPGGFTERQATLGDVSGTIGRFEQMDALFLPGIQAGSIFVVEYDYTTSTPAFRCWVEFNKQDTKGDPASLVTSTLSFVGTLDADGRQVATGP